MSISRRSFLRTMRDALWVSLPFAALVPARAAFEAANGDAWLQQTHAIGVALIACATDNAMVYPEGKSSTETFQKLLDGNYVSDSTIFYLPFPGKVKPAGGQKLKPEDVAFDVTCCVDGSSPDALPLVFSTGYKVTYVGGITVMPVAKPAPIGMAVAGKNNTARFLKAATDGSLANFLPAGFDAGGKAYRQLTPDGEMK